MNNNETLNDNIHWDELYQKTGKCIVLFQKIEHIFKYAVSRGCFSLVLSNDSSNIPPVEQLKNNANALSQKTMGCVGRLFCDRLLTDSGFSQVDKEISKNEMRLNVSITLGAGNYTIQLKSKIEETINKRNKIVHHLFSTFNLKTKNDLLEANIFLDETYDNALILYNEITELTNHIPELIKNCFANFHITPILNDLYNSPFEKELIVMMQYYAELRIKLKKSNGWTNLADTGDFLSKQCPVAFKECKIKHKTKSLKKIIEKFELFEIEPSSENKQNIKFRMKPGCWIEKDTENKLYLCKNISDGDGYILNSS